jgi:P27 family predicted phage terminase small subunit
MKPPNHLSLESKKWWRKILESWELDDSSFILLKTALEAYDEMTNARATIKKFGFLLKSPTGIPHKNPAIEVLKISRSQFLQAWRMLNFGIEPPGEIGRPPESSRREK